MNTAIKILTPTGIDNTKPINTINLHVCNYNSPLLTMLMARWDIENKANQPLLILRIEPGVYGQPATSTSPKMIVGDKESIFGKNAVLFDTTTDIPSYKFLPPQAIPPFINTLSLFDQPNLSGISPTVNTLKASGMWYKNLLKLTIKNPARNFKFNIEQMALFSNLRSLHYIESEDNTNSTPASTIFDFAGHQNRSHFLGLKNLVTLEIKCNQLDLGKLPFAKMTLLKELDFCCNTAPLKLPMEIEKLTNLRSLNIIFFNKNRTTKPSYIQASGVNFGLLPKLEDLCIHELFMDKFIFNPAKTKDEISLTTLHVTILLDKSNHNYALPPIFVGKPQYEDELAVKPRLCLDLLWICYLIKMDETDIKPLYLINTTPAYQKKITTLIKETGVFPTRVPSLKEIVARFVVNQLIL